jgi:hypothetical protein
MTLSLGAGDPLAVDPGDEVDDPVGRRVRGPDGERLRLEVSGARLGLLRPGGHLHVLLGREPALAGGVVLSQGVADERVVAEDAAQVRVPGEVEPIKIEGLPLEPVRRGPDLASGRERGGRPVRQQDLHPHVLVLREGMEVDDGLETGLLPLALEVVHAGEVQKQVVPAIRIVTEKAGDRRPVRRRDLECREIQVADLDPVREGRRGEQAANPLGGRGESRRGDGAQAGFSAASLADRPSRESSPDRIFRCNSRIPYISSSGVGGQPGT